MDRSQFAHFVSQVIGSATSHIIDASNEGIAYVFQPGTTDPITHIGFRYGARTGTPPTYSARLEGVDATGLPDNTDVGSTAATFTPPASTAWDGTWQWIALGSAYTPSSHGQILCATIRHSSGTIDGSNNSSFTRGLANHSGIAGFPYHAINTGGTWSKSSAVTTFGWRTASGRFGYIGQSGYSTVTANTTGHRSCMKFRLPSGEGSSFTVRGARGVAKCGAASGSYKFILTDSSGTILQDITIDADVDANVAGNQPRMWMFDEASLAALSYGTDYYIGFEVVSGTVGVGGITLADAADRDGYPNGLNRCLGTSTGGAFTDTTTVIPFLDPIVDSISPASGGGGAVLIGGLGITGMGSF